MNRIKIVEEIRNLVGAECGMRYHTPMLLFHIEFASLFYISSLLIHTALLWSTVNHANCMMSTDAGARCQVSPSLHLYARG
jgi:hypothetical protein